MANTIKPKRSNTASKVPNTTELVSGELGVNMADKKIYINNGTSVVQVGAGLLSALGDVTITTPASGQTLSYNGTAWVNSSAGTGTVTSVTGTAPVVSSGGTTPAISMAAATASVNGYMTSTYASKLDGIAAGATNVTNTNQLTNGAGFITSSGTSAACSGNAATATALSTASGSAPSYAARAWVNFNGYGTVAIRASGNVSSITDNGVGNYTINITTALPDANYAMVVSTQGTTTGSIVGECGVYTQATNAFNTPTTTAFRLTTWNSAVSGLADTSYVMAAIFR